MKKLIVSLAAALPLIVFAQYNAEKDPFLIKSLAGAGIKTAEVSTSGGSISVTGITTGDPRIEVFVRPSNGDKNISKEETQKRLDADYTLEITTTNNKLVAIAKPKEKNMNWKKALNISFKIWVPQQTSTDLATSGGSINLTNLKGNQEFATSGGSLNIETLSGKIKGRTSGGSINLENSNDEMDLATSGGSINANNCNGKMKLATSGGSLNLDNLNGEIDASTSGGSVKGKNIKGTLEAHTSGGSITFREMACNLETATSGGHIDVEMKELKEYVRIENSGGNVELSVPAGKGLDLNLEGNRINTNKLSNFSGSMEEDEVNGKVNGGGTSIKVKAKSGRVNLHMK